MSLGDAAGTTRCSEYGSGPISGACSEVCQQRLTTSDPDERWLSAVFTRLPDDGRARPAELPTGANTVAVYTGSRQQDTRRNRAADAAVSDLIHSTIDAVAVYEIVRRTKLDSPPVAEEADPMFIQTESTPNPETLKFLPDQAVLESGTASFSSSEESGRSPLASRIFSVEGVAGVFLGRDFITVTREPRAEWQPMKPLLLAAIMQHYASGDPTVTAPADSVSEAMVRPEDAEIVAEIRELIDTRVRPAVAGHGGDIVFHGYREGVVMLEMHGACSGCPSSMTTLKMGVENMLRHYIPAIQEVREVM